MRQRVVSFDTLAFVKKIESSGLQLKQAESIAEAISDVFEENLSSSIFTKEDGNSLRSELKDDVSRLEVNISKLESELKTSISELKSEFKTDISKLETRIIMWAVGLLFGQSAVMISIMMKLFH